MTNAEYNKARRAGWWCKCCHHPKEGDLRVRSIRRSTKQKLKELVR